MDVLSHALQDGSIAACRLQCCDLLQTLLHLSMLVQILQKVLPLVFLVRYMQTILHVQQPEAEMPVMHTLKLAQQ